MANDLINQTAWVLGLDKEPGDLTFLNIAVRGVVIFLVALIMVRMGDKRFFAKKTAFDVILGLILASTLARAINGSAPFFATIGGCFVLVFLHRIFAFGAFHSDWFGQWIKGEVSCVVRDGKFIKEAMEKHHITERDIIEDLRLRTQFEDISEIEKAYLERNGRISFIPKEKGMG